MLFYIFYIKNSCFIILLLYGFDADELRMAVAETSDITGEIELLLPPPTTEKERSVATEIVLAQFHG